MTNFTSQQSTRMLKAVYLLNNASKCAKFYSLYNVPMTHRVGIQTLSDGVLGRVMLYPLAISVNVDFLCI